MILLCPICHQYLQRLVLHGYLEFLFSREGITQGDPLLIFIYAIGTLPLIHSLEDTCRWTQLWYAAGGLLDYLLNFFVHQGHLLVIALNLFIITSMNLCI